MGDIIVFAIIVGLIPIVIAIFANADKAAVDRERNEREQKARELEEQFRIRRQAVLQELMGELPFKAFAMLDGATGFIGMDKDGKFMRLISCREDEASLTVSSDETLSIKNIKSVSIDQPYKDRIITHIDKTPVAVGTKRSPGGRALIGAAIAGPAGAIIGGMSGLGGKSQVEQIETKRHETVQVKGQPKLVIAIDDLSKPRRILKFETVSETNEWSARIFTAINRR